MSNAQQIGRSDSSANSQQAQSQNGPGRDSDSNGVVPGRLDGIKKISQSNGSFQPLPPQRSKTGISAGTVSSRIQNFKTLEAAQAQVSQPRKVTRQATGARDRAVNAADQATKALVEATSTPPPVAPAPTPSNDNRVELRIPTATTAPAIPGVPTSSGAWRPSILNESQQRLDVEKPREISQPSSSPLAAASATAPLPGVAKTPAARTSAEPSLQDKPNEVIAPTPPPLPPASTGLQPPGILKRPSQARKTPAGKADGDNGLSTEDSRTSAVRASLEASDRSRRRITCSDGSSSKIPDTAAQPKQEDIPKTIISREVAPEDDTVQAGQQEVQAQNPSIVNQPPRLVETSKTPQERSTSKVRSYAAKITTDEAQRPPPTFHPAGPSQKTYGRSAQYCRHGKLKPETVLVSTDKPAFVTKRSSSREQADANSPWAIMARRTQQSDREFGNAVCQECMFEHAKRCLGRDDEAPVCTRPTREEMEQQRHQSSPAFQTHNAQLPPQNSQPDEPIISPPLPSAVTTSSPAPVAPVLPAPSPLQPISVAVVSKSTDPGKSKPDTASVTDTVAVPNKPSVEAKSFSDPTQTSQAHSEAANPGLPVIPGPAPRGPLKSTQTCQELHRNEREPAQVRTSIQAYHSVLHSELTAIGNDLDTIMQTHSAEIRHVVYLVSSALCNDQSGGDTNVGNRLVNGIISSAEEEHRGRTRTRDGVEPWLTRASLEDDSADQTTASAADGSPTTRSPVTTARDASHTTETDPIVVITNLIRSIHEGNNTPDPAPLASHEEMLADQHRRAQEVAARDPAGGPVQIPAPLHIPHAAGTRRRGSELRQLGLMRPFAPGETPPARRQGSGRQVNGVQVNGNYVNGHGVNGRQVNGSGSHGEVGDEGA